MKKRIRKKLHKGEFQELGFRVLVTMKEDLTSEARETFLDEFILQAIETKGLLFEGGTDELELRGFVNASRPRFCDGRASWWGGSLAQEPSRSD